MFAATEQFIALQRQSLESIQAIAQTSLDGLEKLAQLNVQAARASVEERVQRSKSLLESKDVKAMAETLTGSATGDKLTAYVKHVYEIASETNAEIAKTGRTASMAIGPSCTLNEPHALAKSTGRY